MWKKIDNKTMTMTENVREMLQREEKWENEAEVMEKMSIERRAELKKINRIANTKKLREKRRNACENEREKKDK